MIENSPVYPLAMMLVFFFFTESYILREYKVHFPN